MVDNITSVWLPTNNDTLTLNYNQRVLISDPRKYPPIAWTISKYEDTQPMGLIKLKFTQETFDPAHDNAELMLANYYDSPITPEVPDPSTELQQTATIIYSGTKPTIKVGGSWKIFTSVFSDETVTVDKWTISDENGDISGNTNYTIKYVGNQMKLKVAQNYNLIGTVLIVQVFGSDSSTAEIQIEVI